ncbi:DUF305 domain-containing protein [Amycolatopsis sp. H20-H5]|uniref:DUF305 domain-containing protein n=1 Tax=Amycolatopsis sp. H20-H5 TaxID=3046309 RepID=UPI002DB7C0F9|nr:DUF305 domain-containing protein [Amycolatopsis sp. H20-H5]MEC3974007.1 DUF305 domain-containing protein [Amycolatopsis sp. H20-H5]
MKTRLPAGLLGLVLVAVLTACSAEAKPPGANATDIRFSLEMIPHHAQTIELADLVPHRGSHPFITDVATRVKTDETAEIEQMSSWQSWNVPLPQSSHHMAGMDMPGMATEAEVVALRTSSGPEFDQLWLSTLAKHLRSGVDMAKATQAGGGIHPGTRDLTRKVITEQEAAIADITRQQSSST